MEKEQPNPMDVTEMAVLGDKEEDRDGKHGDGNDRKRKAEESLETEEIPEKIKHKKFSNQKEKNKEDINKKSPKMSVKACVKYFLDMEEKLQKNNYDHVIVANEMNQLFSPLKKLPKQHPGVFLAVTLAMKSDGTKYAPLIFIRKDENDIERQYKEGKLDLMSLSKPEFNNSSINSFVEEVIRNTGDGKTLLVWNSRWVHRTDMIKNALIGTGIDLRIISRRETFMMPSETFFRNDFLETSIKLYEDWLRTLLKSTSDDPPTREDYSEWINKAWEKYTSEQIQKALTMYGLRNGPDGVDDSKIYCFRVYKELSRGRRLMKKQRLCRAGKCMKCMRNRLGDSEMNSSVKSSDANVEPAPIGNAEMDSIPESNPTHEDDGILNQDNKAIEIGMSSNQDQ